MIFYANQLRDSGLIKSDMNDIAANVTEFHLLNECGQEMKG